MPPMNRPYRVLAAACRADERVHAVTNPGATSSWDERYERRRSLIHDEGSRCGRHWRRRPPAGSAWMRQGGRIPGVGLRRTVVNDRPGAVLLDEEKIIGGAAQ